MAMSVVYSNFCGMITHENRGGTERAYMPDPLGSTAALLDNSQNKTDTWEYWPYGEVASRTGTNSTPFTFCGIWGYFKDLPDRLIYVRARFLRPDLALWATVDPLWPSQAPFTYTSDAPVIFTDSSGQLHDKRCPGICASKCTNPPMVEPASGVKRRRCQCADLFGNYWNCSRTYACGDKDIGSLIDPGLGIQDPDLGGGIFGIGISVGGILGGAVGRCFSWSGVIVSLFLYQMGLISTYNNNCRAAFQVALFRCRRGNRVCIEQDFSGHLGSIELGGPSGETCTTRCCEGFGDFSMTFGR